MPRKLWLHNGGHGGESASDTADFALYKRTENRWFDLAPVAGRSALGF